MANILLFFYCYLCAMADVHDTATRNFNMSRIKGKNTKPEILLRKFLLTHAYRYRLHDNKLPEEASWCFMKI